MIEFLTGPEKLQGCVTGTDSDQWDIMRIL